MTERERLLEAVAEAARSALHDAPGAHERLSTALDALDAHQPQQAEKETVTLAVWEHDDGMVAWYRAGSRTDTPYPGWTRLGTTTLRLDAEVRT